MSSPSKSIATVSDCGRSRYFRQCAKAIWPSFRERMPVLVCSHDQADGGTARAGLRLSGLGCDCLGEGKALVEHLEQPLLIDGFGQEVDHLQRQQADDVVHVRMAGHDDNR